MKKNIHLLDCTFRDGGYYNNWDFPHEVVNNYLVSMSKIGIRYVELGFRSFEVSSFKGPNYYTTDFYLNTLTVPKNLRLAVMVNASQLTRFKSIALGVKKLFKPSNQSKIKLIRIACHFNEIDATIKIVHECIKLGYEVAVNLMQISEQSDETIGNISRKLNNLNLKVLYFADSLGSMRPQDIINTLGVMKKNFNKPIGVHMHDNMQNALINTLTSIENGATWVDSTITGMGRGAGNVKTEHLIPALQKSKKINFDISLLLKLKKDYFDINQKKYNWGSNVFYFLAAQNRIHPTYIQEMISMKFSDLEILAAIDQLTISGATKYNVDLVRTDFQKEIKLKEGSWSPSKVIQNKDILLLASGPKLKENEKIISNFVKKNKPFVIALNSNLDINEDIINIYLACNPLKIISELKNLRKIKKPLVIPCNIIQKDILKKLNNNKVLNFGVGLNLNKYIFKKKGAVVPRLYNLVYALSVATSGNAKKIYLAGFDGYGLNDNRTKLVNDLLYNYSATKGSKEIIAITPSSYSVNFKSIYTF